MYHVFSRLIFYFYFCSLPSFSQDFESREITVYDWQIDHPGQSLSISEDYPYNSEISIDVFKELNLNANLMMTRTNIFGGVQNLYLRGSNADQIQITYDGAVLNDPSHPSRGYNFSEFSSFSLSSVDIYYGPLSTVIGNFANAGAVSLKSRDVENPTLLLKAGSYESYGHTFLVPVKKLKQQWEWQSFKSRGMSSASNGQEHDGLTDHRLKVKGKLNLPSTYSANYFILARWRKEDLDFGGGVEPDDQNYFSKDRMLLPYLELNGNLSDCISNKVSLQKTFRKRETDNQADALNTNESLFLSRAELDVAKLSFDQQCFQNLSSKVVIEHNKEIMNSQQQGDITGVMDPKEQTTDSISLNQDIIIDTINRISVGAKIDYWKNETDLGSYRFGYSHITNYNILIAPSISYGRKIPSLYQLYSVYGNEKLEREKNWQYEVLLSREKNNTSWELVSFLGQYKEMVDYDFVTDKYINSGANKIFGFELRNFWKINSQMGQKFNLNYLRAYNSESSNELLLRPKWQGSYSLNYQLERSSAGLQAQYIGSRKAVDAISFVTLETSSIFLMHALYQYSLTSNLKIDLSWQNILNKRYNFIPGYSSLGSAVFAEVSYEF